LIIFSNFDDKLWQWQMKRKDHIDFLHQVSHRQCLPQSSR
jgi:hypothetical protein